MNGRPGERWRFWLTTAATLAMWALHNAVLLPLEEAAWPEAIRRPAQLLLRALVWLPPIVVHLRRTGQRPLLATLGLSTRVDRRGLLAASVPAVVYLGLALALARASSQAPAAPGSWLAGAAWLGSAAAAYTLVGAALEEVLMRGFVLRQQLRWATPVRAQAVTALLFAAMHVFGWVALGMSAAEVIPSLLVVLVQGAVLGYVAYRSGSIVPAILLHVLNNAMSR